MLWYDDDDHHHHHDHDHDHDNDDHDGGEDDDDGLNVPDENGVTEKQTMNFQNSAPVDALTNVHPFVA